jgi:uncharacterized cupredoxin-like copper-binding protein
METGVMKHRATFLTPAALFAAAMFAASPALAAAPALHFTIHVLRGEQAAPGPDHHGHDMIVPANLVLKAGQPVVLTIINYDEGAHTITAEKMGVNIQVKAGHEQKDGSVTPVTTVARFTPTKKGIFRWHCLLSCDKGGHYWAMSQGYDGPGQDGFMAGYFIVM